MLDENKVVLIIEENEELFEELYDELLDYQFEVTSASDFGEALNILNKSGNDIGLLISNEFVDGESFVDFKENMIDQGFHVPTILITDGSHAQIAEDLSRLKVFKVLHKPIDIDELKEVIENIEKVA